MVSKQSFLSDDDVKRIERLLEVLDRSSIDYLRVDAAGLKITLGKDEFKAVDASSIASSATLSTTMAPVSSSLPTEKTEPSKAPALAPAAVSGGGDIEIVKATMMGRFYSRSEEGAAPFIAVGDMVEKDTTVGLIEVMKTFTSVSAGMAGRVVDILVADEDIVEFGQPLFKLAKV